MPRRTIPSPIPSPTRTIPHQDINLPTSITAHEQPLLSIKRQSHGSKTVSCLRAFGLVCVVEDVGGGSRAVWWREGVARGGGKGYGG